MGWNPGLELFGGAWEEGGNLTSNKLRVRLNLTRNQLEVGCN